MKKLVRRVISGLLTTTLVLGMSVAVYAEPTDTPTTVTFGSAVYVSELTGLPISTSLQAQRPIAVMIDNETKAYNHYGVSEADIVYEMMNSTKNGRITRLMAIYKDYNSIPQIGSIRSTRPTNCMIAPEYNAILVHDGGPFYINTYLVQPYLDNLSGGFTRVKNGKPTEFTEYVKAGEAASRANKAKYSLTYNAYANPRITSHFLFNATDTPLSTTYGTVTPATSIDLSGSFQHTKSKLVYDAATGTYNYYAYGNKHVDAEDSQPTMFKNVILQVVPFTEYDANGYMVYNVVGTGSGYYITDGQCVPITWAKTSDNTITQYMGADGKEIKVNAGKTYIGLIPADTASTTVIQ